MEIPLTTTHDSDYKEQSIEAPEIAQCLGCFIIKIYLPVLFWR